jgi:hypothetical protein
MLCGRQHLKEHRSNIECTSSYGSVKSLFGLGQANGSLQGMMTEQELVSESGKMVARYLVNSLEPTTILVGIMGWIGIFLHHRAVWLRSSLLYRPLLLSLTQRT